MDRQQRRKLAEQIANDLFTDCDGSTADRLEMKHGQHVSLEKSGGGWCWSAAVKRIESRLAEINRG